jgi:hypothetical protein
VLTDFQYSRSPHLCVDAVGIPIQIPGLKRNLHRANPPKISMLKWKYHCIHPKSKTKIFNTSKTKYPEETRFLEVKSATQNSRLKNYLCISISAGLQYSRHWRWLCCGSAEIEMFYRKKNKKIQVWWDPCIVVVDDGYL